MKVIFHSDGNVTEIMDGLVDAGIDGFNPIDVAAGMDSYLLRKKYPELILVGGVDGKSLLLNGTIDEIRAETRKLIENLGRQGRLLIGSTTEVAANIPLGNYTAFHDETIAG
jgi:uroporphyrinogen decarboxylase